MGKYEEKLQKLDAHLKEHPTDYQAVISRLKTYSKAVEHERQRKVNERLRKVAEYRRMLNEE